MFQTEECPAQGTIISEQMIERFKETDQTDAISNEALDTPAVTISQTQKSSDVWISDLTGKLEKQARILPVQLFWLPFFFQWHASIW